MLDNLPLEFVWIGASGSGRGQSQLGRIDVTKVGWHVFTIRRLTNAHKICPLVFAAAFATSNTV